MLNRQSRQSQGAVLGFVLWCSLYRELHEFSERCHAPVNRPLRVQNCCCGGFSPKFATRLRISCSSVGHWNGAPGRKQNKTATRQMEDTKSTTHCAAHNYLPCLSFLTSHLYRNQMLSWAWILEIKTMNLKRLKWLKQNKSHSKTLQNLI